MPEVIKKILLTVHAGLCSQHEGISFDLSTDVLLLRMSTDLLSAFKALLT
jgi:hypothetical protein